MTGPDRHLELFYLIKEIYTVGKDAGIWTSSNFSQKARTIYNKWNRYVEYITSLYDREALDIEVVETTSDSFLINESITGNIDTEIGLSWLSDEISITESITACLDHWDIDVSDSFSIGESISTNIDTEIGLSWLSDTVPLDDTATADIDVPPVTSDGFQFNESVTVSIA